MMPSGGAVLHEVRPYSGRGLRDGFDISVKNEDGYSDFELERGEDAEDISCRGGEIPGRG